MNATTFLKGLNLGEAKRKNDYDGIVLVVKDEQYKRIFNYKTSPVFNKIAVLRTDTMGYGIAQFFAQNQIIVIGHDTNQAMRSTALNRLDDQKGMEKYSNCRTGE